MMNMGLGRLLILRSVFLASPLRRQVIVKEKLVFPSGSMSTHPQLIPGPRQETDHVAATAQLIALLHEIPPPSQTISATSTAGTYRRIPHTSDPTDMQHSTSDEGPRPIKTEQSEVMGSDGWQALGWSFLASGLLTVSQVAFFGGRRGLTEYL